MDKKKPLRGKKKLFIEALTKSLGNITTASKSTKIDRSVHYWWLKHDTNYKLWVSDLPDIEIDFYESALRKLINDGNPAATIFACKTKGKNRGWVERTEVLHEGLLKVSESDVRDVEEHLKQILK